MKLHTICLVLIAYICITTDLARATTPACTLDGMRKYAAEACEHLFRSEHRGRDKRSYKHNEIVDEDYVKNGYRRNVKRGNYPLHGYLKVDQYLYRKLTEMDVHPRYKPHKHFQFFQQHEQVGNRFKRAHSSYYTNIPYCCQNNCKDDFFS